MPLIPGQVLKDRYRVAKLLAQGGFGAVYRAWDLNLNNAVALKENLTTSAESLKQFALEARLLANLRQENLPYVIDHFSLPGQGQYLVMEFVEGKDLQSMLDENGTLSETQAVTWFTQVCSALIYLHGQSPPVIHRDIKPANIKITPQGQVMLVDFGIAKVYDPSGRTTAGARAVTQGFSPPEQYGSGRTDARSDIYALGATLYAALTGQTPLDSLQRRLGHSMPLPTALNPTISPAMEQVILRAMQLEPDQRFASVREFRHALTASRLNPEIVIRSPAAGAAAIPATQVAASNAPFAASNAPFAAPPQGFPATQQSAAPLPESYVPPAPYSAGKYAPVAQSAPKGRTLSAFLIFAIVACLLVSVVGVAGGAFYYFSLATPTRTPVKDDLSWATRTMQALITLQTHVPTDAPVDTPTAPPTSTRAIPPSATFPPPPPSRTPIPSFTATHTLTPTATPNPHATWFPCAGTYPSRLHVGDRAVVSSDPPLANRVRKEPNTSSDILGLLEVGERMEILEGPVCFGGWIWWRVRSLEKNLSGWTAEGDNENYWLVPSP